MILLNHYYSHQVIYDRMKTELLIDIENETNMYTQPFLDPSRLERWAG